MATEQGGRRCELVAAIARLEALRIYTALMRLQIEEFARRGVVHVYFAARANFALEATASAAIAHLIPGDAIAHI